MLSFGFGEVDGRLAMYFKYRKLQVFVQLSTKRQIFLG